MLSIYQATWRQELNAVSPAVGRQHKAPVSTVLHAKEIFCLHSCAAVMLFMFISRLKSCYNSSHFMHFFSCSPYIHQTPSVFPTGPNLILHIVTAHSVFPPSWVHAHSPVPCSPCHVIILATGSHARHPACCLFLSTFIIFIIKPLLHVLDYPHLNALLFIQPARTAVAYVWSPYFCFLNKIVILIIQKG